MSSKIREWYKALCEEHKEFEWFVIKCPYEYVILQKGIPITNQQAYETNDLALWCEWNSGFENDFVPITITFGNGLIDLKSSSSLGVIIGFAFEDPKDAMMFRLSFPEQTKGKSR